MKPFPLFLPLSPQPHPKLGYLQAHLRLGHWTETEGQGSIKATSEQYFH